MNTYASLQLNRFYLVKENENEEIVLVQPVMETDACYLVMHHDDYESAFWRKKEDSIYEIVDELTDEQLAEYENLFTDEKEEEWEEE
ncbi:hypothetical protein [Foetidibacter luteolus]|uniref:hypothetical protein n=1 Tax=Foetidibacter luteolus TaxID=2608880 RepID=UPI00129B56DA|nr:hypothetical protein [Foetidibacter luteolus]